MLEIGLLASTLGIGWIDWLTGAELNLAIFYLMPIVGAGWASSRRSAVFHGFAAAVCWFVADISLRTDEYLLVPLWNAFTGLFIFVGLGLLIAVVRSNQADLKASLDRERRLVHTDATTGLPNSRAFMKELAGQGEQKHAGPIGVIFLDLDNFKRVNDDFGHAEGDAVLREVGRALRAAVRRDDVAARIGGDEFAILALDVDRVALREIAARIVTAIEALGRRYPGTGLGASVGLCHLEAAPSDLDQMLRLADQAMYAAKTEGKGRVHE